MDENYNFLDNMNNINYKSEIKEKETNIENEKENIKQNKILYKQQKLFEKEQKETEKLQKKIEIKNEKNYKSDEDDNLYSDRPTKLIGKDKMIIQHKINSYRELFKTELKSFKIKKNASTEELQDCLTEMEHIIETGTVNQFSEDSIIQCIKIIEGVSSRTK